MKVPRLVIAAAASGQGKTTVAVGIMAALARRGLQVSPGKVGPDYIDPGYHALATGRPGRNLDPWLTDPDLVIPLLLNGFQTPAPADVAIIEGVMGLFDGQLGTDGFASTAHIARLTDSPVLLVIDVSSASRTVGAIVHGLRTFDPAIRIAGVVLNKAGSPRHATEVRRTVEALGLPVVGVLPRDGAVSAPSRHLGLVPAEERLDAASALDRLAEHTAEGLDLDLILELARSAPDLDTPAWQPPVAAAPRDGQRRPVVAVAGGRAFTFRYAETAELLAAAGCEVVVFDPATDRALPAGTSGLYLGGGFPEAHAGSLTGNAALRTDIRHAIEAGMPTVAECAGLLYLGDVLDGAPMVGAVPATAAMASRLTLGYRTATLAVDSVLGPAGTVVHTHEFHRTTTVPAAGESPAWLIDGRPDGFALDPAGTGRATVHASYQHVHWAGHPQLAQSFAAAVHDYAAHDGQTAALSAPPALAHDPATLPDHDTTQPATPLRAHGTTAYDLDHHGDAEVRDGDHVDLAVNVRLASPPAWLAQVIQDCITGLGAYPDPTAARAAIAARHGVPAEMVLLTSGAAEAFTLIARGITGRHPLIVHPQFTEPESALRRAGRVPARHLLRAETGFVLDASAVDPDADLVFVGNPTNPTGVLHPASEVANLHRTGRVVVVDEAFADAIPGERASLIGPQMRNRLVLRSLTKTWAVAGLRAGYVIGDPMLIAALAQQQPHWSVSTPALAVTVATATDTARLEAERAARDLAAQRAHLVSRLAEVGLQAIPGEAPFVLVRAGAGVREALRNKGFAVRRGDTFPGLDASWIRIAVRDIRTTDALITALAAVLPTDSEVPA